MGLCYISLLTACNKSMVTACCEEGGSNPRFWLNVWTKMGLPWTTIPRHPFNHYNLCFHCREGPIFTGRGFVSSTQPEITVGVQMPTPATTASPSTPQARSAQTLPHPARVALSSTPPAHSAPLPTHSAVRSAPPSAPPSGPTAHFAQASPALSAAPSLLFPLGSTSPRTPCSSRVLLQASPKALPETSQKRPLTDVN